MLFTTENKSFSHKPGCSQYLMSTSCWHDPVYAPSKFKKYSWRNGPHPILLVPMCRRTTISIYIYLSPQLIGWKETYCINYLNSVKVAQIINNQQIHFSNSFQYQTSKIIFKPVSIIKMWEGNFFERKIRNTTN